jgi:response regulator RpfG family c-di-GMP phosphodiesterase
MKYSPLHLFPSLLVIEDDAGVRRMLAQALGENYHCDAAASAAEARRKLSEQWYSVVLADIFLGDGSGLDLLGEMKAADPDVQWIIVSGSRDLASPIEALKLGADDYLPKPFTGAQLEQAVAKAVARRAEQLEARQRHEELIESLTESLCESREATLRALGGALSARDLETGHHTERVAVYCTRLGRELKLSDEQLLGLQHGALLHDIGKIGTPDAVLLKAGELSAAEWLVMREHIAHGGRIVRELGDLTDALPVVVEHHEKFDGTGYPLGLKGEQISIEARIFAVADAYDAITNDRPYRRGRAYEAARAEIEKGAGTHFDPRVVAAFKGIDRREWVGLREQVGRFHLKLREMERRVLRTRFMTDGVSRVVAAVAEAASTRRARAATALSLLRQW